jgi:aryl-alcohol dehydrogenase
MAAKLVDSRIIIAVDLHEHRLKIARDLGATHVLNAGKVDVITEIKRITGSGVQYALEATGHSSVADQAVRTLDRNGRLAYVAGAPNLSEDAVKKRKLTIMAVVAGNSVPQVFIPRLIEFYKLGKFPFDKLVKYYPFDEINRAVADARSGSTIKPVITMP